MPKSNPPPAAPTGSASLDPSLAVAVRFANNLRQARTARGWSLERLAQASGVSRAMLSQIELSQSVPTLQIVWKIVAALDLPFSTLLEGESGALPIAVVRGEQMRTVASEAGAFVSRLISSDAAVELYALTLAKRHRHQAAAHAPHTRERLWVLAGGLVVTVGTIEHVLCAGDAISFNADVPHVYDNPHDEPAQAVLAMTYGAVALLSGIAGAT